MPRLTIPDDLPGRLAYVRGCRRLSAAGVARQAGIHRNYLAALEAGTSSPTVTVLRRLAAVLGVTCAQLLGEEPV